jgi:hypothetical protein
LLKPIHGLTSIYPSANPYSLILIRKNEINRKSLRLLKNTQITPKSNMIIGKKDNVQENKQKNLILASEIPLDWDHHAIASLIQGTLKIFPSSINVSMQ